MSAGCVAAGVPVAFELSGGPGCGAVMAMPMPANDTVLIEFPAEGAPEVKHVWAYRFANRSTDFGWLLEAVRWVAYRGLPAAQEEEEI